MIEDRLILGTGYGDAWTLTYSPGFRICDVLPSIDTPAGDLLRSPICELVSRDSLGRLRIRALTRNVMTDDAGKTSGRNDRLRGQIGVRTSALSEGCTIGPPADSEYAVDPVGVETMRPSDYALC